MFIDQNALLNFLNALLVGANGLVTLGVLFEGLELTRFKEKAWCKFINMLGFILLILGLSSEIYLQSKIDTITSQIRLEAEQLKSRVVWRKLSTNQCTRLADYIKGLNGLVVVEYPIGDPEALQYAISFGNCFTEIAKWKLETAAVAFKDILPIELIITGLEGKNFEAAKIGLKQAGLKYTTNDKPIEQGVAQRLGTGGGLHSDLKIIVGSRPIFLDPQKN